MSGLKMVVHLHNEMLHSRKKEGIPTFCNSVSGTRGYILNEISQAVKDKYIWSHLWEESKEQNELMSKTQTGMDTWNRPTAVREE